MNIVLIGMPSSGKSTIGGALSERLGMRFADTDLILKEKAGKALRDIVLSEGLDTFLKMQEASILEQCFTDRVIATGGSVIYSEASMKHLGTEGMIVYLQIPFDEVEQRITTERRFARANGQSFKDLYEERTPLYEKYAHFTIHCSQKSVEDITCEIHELYKQQK